MAPAVTVFHGFAFLRGGSEGTNATGSREGPDGMGAALGNGIAALSCVVGTVCSDAADLLVLRDLAEKIG